MAGRLYEVVLLFSMVPVFDVSAVQSAREAGDSPRASRLHAAGQRPSLSDTLPMKIWSSCSRQNVSLRVEASEEARKDLSGWLAKDTTLLVFIYFDLVVSSVTYHPGSCPNDGKTAIDAQTPLAWVLTSGGPNGGGDIGTHSFAHAYLTLPVSYPRIYSMGILDGHYVASMRHEVLRNEHRG